MEHFNTAVLNMLKMKKENCKILTKEKYVELLHKVKISKLKATGKQTIDYRRLKIYDVLKVGDSEKLIYPISKENPNVKFYVHTEELFYVIHEAHLVIGHGGRNRMMKELRAKYRNVTIEEVMIYLNLCEYCLKKNGKYREKLGGTNDIFKNEVSMLGNPFQYAAYARVEL